MEPHHDEVGVFLLLPCMEADLQLHLHCSDQALTWCQRDTSLSTWKEPPGYKSALSYPNQCLYKLKGKEEACVNREVTTKVTT